MKEKLIIFGNGEFGSIANYYFKNNKISYFCVDDNSTAENLIFNRTATLKDFSAKKK